MLAECLTRVRMPVCLLNSPGLFSVFSQQVFCLDSLNPSFNFKLFASPYQSFEDCSGHANYNMLSTPHTYSTAFLILIGVRTCLRFCSFDYHLVVRWDSKIHQTVSSLIFLIITRSSHLAGIK